MYLGLIILLNFTPTLHADGYVDAYVAGVADYQKKLKQAYPNSKPPLEAQKNQYAQSLAEAQLINEQDRVKAKVEALHIEKQVSEELKAMRDGKPESAAKIPATLADNPTTQPTVKSRQKTQSLEDRKVETGGAKRISFHAAKPDSGNTADNGSSGAQAIGSFSNAGGAENRAVSSFSKDTGDE